MIEKTIEKVKSKFDSIKLNQKQLTIAGTSTTSVKKIGQKTTGKLNEIGDWIKSKKTSILKTETNKKEEKKLITSPDGKVKLFII